MNKLLILFLSTIVLLSVTYYLTIRDNSNENFTSENIPEFNYSKLKVTEKACEAAMKRCRSGMPFCLNSRGGPLLDCVREYGNFFSKDWIPSYSKGDWDKFSF